MSNVSSGTQFYFIKEEESESGDEVVKKSVLSIVNVRHENEGK
jgi:hypothetical protein